MSDTKSDFIVRQVLAERVKLLALIRSIVGRRDIAEEIFQDLCLLVLQKRHELIGSDHLPGWLRTASRHLAMNAKRKAASEAILLGEEIHDLLDPTWCKLDGIAGAPMADALAVCVGLLKPKEKQLIFGRYTDGLRIDELARRVDRPLNTLYTTLGRIHKKLSECILRRIAAQERLHAR